MNTGGYFSEKEVDEMTTKEISRLIDILKSFGLSYEQIEKSLTTSAKHSAINR